MSAKLTVNCVFSQLCMHTVLLEIESYLCVFCQSEHFPFLGTTNSTNVMSDMRCRTTFYASLGRFLLVDFGEDEEKFYQFMLPLTGM